MPKSQKAEYRDPALESEAGNTQEIIERLETSPTYENVRRVARALQGLNLSLDALGFYGDEYANRGQHFIDLGTRGMEAARKVPEVITRTDQGADRSAHALIKRTAGEIKVNVKRSCATPTPSR